MARRDCRLIDLVMPNMNGLEALREISQALPGLPIVLHTLYVSNILEVEAEKNGISWVLPKWEGYKLVSQIRGFFTERTLSENRLRTTDKESDSLGTL
jgi:CheY-like chemotaxis protein